MSAELPDVAPEPNETDMVFARQLRRHREAAGLSQKQMAYRIAEKLGTHFVPSQVTRSENMGRGVWLREAVAMAEVLNLPLAALLSDDFENESDREIKQLMIELTGAEAAWERNRTEIARLTHAIAALTTQREVLQRNPRG